MKISSRLWKDIELVEEFPKALGRKLPIRVYRASDHDRWRWFLGFPREAVKPLCPLLESSPYWGEIHCAEDGDFWLWWQMILTNSDEIPLKELNRALAYSLNLAQRCIETLDKLNKSTRRSHADR